MQPQGTSAALALVPRDDLAASPIRSAEELAAAYLLGFREATRSAYAGDLKAWFGWLGGLGLDPLDAHRVHVETWCRVMEEDGMAPSTVGRRLSAIGGFYSYGEDEGLIDRSPVKRVKRPRASNESQRLGVDRDQLRALLDVAEQDGPRSHALVCLLGLNGLRVSEALGVDIADLNIERGHRTLGLRRKGGKRQTAPLAPRTSTAIDALTHGRDDGPIFVTRSGRRLDRRAAQKIVRRLARQAGITHSVSPHSLRHGFVTCALDAGVALRDVQDAAGHADPRTTRRYDRGRYSLDRHATYAVAQAVAA
jgi:integrase/recombinase XerD